MSPLRYLSVCSGIEAATVAWKPLGWHAEGFAEIEKFPSAVLRHHYPDVPNFGDMTQFKDWDAAFDVLVGGTPCQSFSVAGLRAGLADPRGNLALTYLAVLDRYRPRWCVWENVPGVLSADDGGALGAFLGGLGQLGYGFAYRVLDAQYFGLAQRRARVFVVGYLGDWRRAAAVLFERASLSGHPAPSREAGQGIAATLTNGFGERGVDADQIANGNYSLAPTIPSRSTTGGGLGTDFDCDGGLVPIQCNGTNIGLELPSLRRGDGGLTSGVPAVAFDWQSGGDSRGLDPKDTAQLQRCQVPAIAFCGDVTPKHGIELSPALRREQGGEGLGVAYGMQVRRLTPRECERLQGFPDDYTLILYRGKPAADGPRYKALGNSMAVPVMAWIGKRIQLVSERDDVASAVAS
jgi:DNA (cytosine-5)-methyltransferase 1